MIIPISHISSVSRFLQCQVLLYCNEVSRKYYISLCGSVLHCYHVLHCSLQKLILKKKKANTSVLVLL